MPQKASVEEKEGQLILRIPCKFESQGTRRYGETTIRFRIEEGYLPLALRAAVGIDRVAVAVIKSRKQKFLVGKVVFGGLRIDRLGEAVLSLDTTAEDMKLQTQKIADLADEEIDLLLAIKMLSNGKGE